MKKALSIFILLSTILALSIVGYAEDSKAARGVACPLCDRASLVTVKYGERSVPSVEPCSHDKIGYDHYTLTYYTYYVRCANNCGYSEAPQSEVLVSKKLDVCGGIST